MNKKFNCYFINATLSTIKNENSGEVVYLTRFTFAIPKDNSTYSVGGAILELYKQGDYIDKVKDKTLKNVSILVDEKLTKNGTKFSLTSIDNLEL